ncbi:DUF6507 family protein [Nocardiopsis salina]|uniref:DUF6507 family protein n=1 Tax=Nocardiopsis salina TaxID=245836 RepID=UPI000345EC4B|nr:DUF6507 family protein [Nocardiopsis salina]
MAHYEIDPQQVSTVLSETGELLGDEDGSDGLAGSLTSIESTLLSLEQGTQSTPITIALGEFGGHYLEMVSDMLSLTGSGIQGTHDATTHYISGDEEMARQAQYDAGAIDESNALPADNR